MTTKLSDEPQRIKYCCKKVYQFIKKTDPKLLKEFKKPILFLSSYKQDFNEFQKLDLLQKFEFFKDTCPKCNLTSTHFHCLHVLFIFIVLIKILSFFYF